ncbi:cytochrome P450 [Streptomyces sp. NPDC058646]|uniref:cytochrome P450 n=1 Tax=Streptomyces sp. NPDC058646 TaxID=3346574 RepID=UPI003646301E
MKDDTNTAAITLPTQRRCPMHPPDEYARLRAEQPVARLAFPDGPPGWLLTRYDDVRAALADLRLSSRRPHLNSQVRASLITEAEMAQFRTSDLLTSDPPEHTRLRHPLIGQFSMRRIRTLRPRIEKYVDEHLDAIAAMPCGPVDLVPALALPVPSLVICELLGVPYTDHDHFQRLTGELLGLDRTREELLASKKAMHAYLRGLVEAKRRDPVDDLLSGLTQHRPPDGGPPLADGEIVSLGQLMLIAGHETSANMISLSILTLLRSPALWQSLQADPSLIDNAVEELLRYHTILQFGLLRVARAALVIRGQRIEPGERVVLHMPAANRDPLKFPDPDRLDLDRPNSRQHLSFGHGPHQCIGQQLGRLEIEIILTKLLHRFPTLQLHDASTPPATHDHAVVYGLRALQVTW